MKYPVFLLEEKTSKSLPTINCIRIRHDTNSIIKKKVNKFVEKKIIGRNRFKNDIDKTYSCWIFFIKCDLLFKQDKTISIIIENR